MKTGCVFFNFDWLKKQNYIPEDALLKNIIVDNESGEIKVIFYTNDKEFFNCTSKEK